MKKNLITADQAKRMSNPGDRPILDSWISHLDCLIRTAANLGNQSVTVCVYPKELQQNFQQIADILTEAGYQYSCNNNNDGDTNITNTQYSSLQPTTTEEISEEKRSSTTPIQLTITW